MKRFLAVLLSVSACWSQGGTNDILRTTADVDAIYRTAEPTGCRFDLMGTVVKADGEGGGIILVDNGKHAWFNNQSGVACSAGQRVRIKGRVEIEPTGLPCPIAESLAVVGQGELPSPRSVALREIANFHDNLAPVIVTGAVDSVRSDKIDPRFVILLLRDGAARLPVFIEKEVMTIPPAGSVVRVTGRFNRTARGMRRFSGPLVIGLSVEVLAPPTDPFDVPPLSNIPVVTPDEIARLGKRKVSGEVFATWLSAQGVAQAMVHSGKANVINVALAEGEALPPVGAVVDAVGSLETDMFRINMRDALWRTSSAVRTNSPHWKLTLPLFRAASDLLEDELGRYRIRGDAHGHIITLAGIVRNLPSEPEPAKRFYLNSGEYKVPVDVSTHPDAAAGLTIGAEVSVTGRWLVETGVPSPFDTFPQITGYALVVRSADDIRVIRNPPWWTPMRCLAAVAILLAVLVVVFLWNMTLHVLVRRRGHQLFKAKYARAQSELHVMERTRLAVELHDALSQNLTGIAFELKTVGLTLDRDREKSRTHLRRAENVLDSCREELRYCLWDLRNDTLSESSLADAIRRTLLPQIGDAGLRVRFDVPRALVSDNTAHAILCIIRELSVNAVRHGAATEIRVAGSHDGDRILFSVRDNGTGFDPAAAPGMDEGHFGLHGIRERLATLDGSLTVESSAGRGTKATVTIVADGNKEDS